MRVKFLTIVMLLFCLPILSQEKTITGVVTSDSGELPGVTIIIKGTTKGAETDFDGKYSIKTKVGDVLVYQYLGFETVERTVGAASVINVVMKVGGEILEEVVVVGYGNKTSLKKSISSITSISATPLRDRTNPSALQQLQGQVSGLNILTGSGQPGADSTILLRGLGSINGNVEPLFIIDGIPVDEDNFRSINPNDIANYTVLKDAAATAIYGNRGANGVIIIKTRRGSLNTALTFSYNASFGASELQDQPFELMNSSEVLNFQRTYNEGLGAGLTDAEILALSRQTNTNWANVFFRTAITSQHNLSLTSGSEKNTNFTSFQYSEQEGIFIGSDFQRISLRNNFTGRSKDDAFDYDLNISLAFSRTDEITDNAGSGSTFFNPFSAALQGLPYLSAFDPDGSQTTDGGITPGDVTALLANGAANFPYVLLNSLSLNTDREDEIKILAGVNANWNFAKNLKAGVKLGMDLSTESRLEILHPESILGPFQSSVGGLNGAQQFGGIHEETYTRDFRFNSTSYINYNNVFNEKHSVDVAGYFEYIKAHLDGFDIDQFGIDPRLVGTGAGFIAGTVTEVVNGNTINPYIDSVNSFTTTVGSISLFATAEYDYDGKYGFSASFRRDNSFRFIEKNQWGNFWSVGGRWNISEESFMDDSAFNLLKLRASYGVTGNDRISGGYYAATNQTRELFGSGQGYNGGIATVPVQRANVNLRWEETSQFNVGADFAVWNNKFSGSFDYYIKVVDNLFQNNQISNINGQSSLLANVGSLENKGVELNLNYTIIDNKDLTVKVFANGSYNENVVTDLPASDGIVNAGGSTALGIGEIANSFYLVRYAGVNPSNGNPLFLTASDQLTETLSDDDRVFVGKSPLPVWQGGFGTNIYYRGFEFSTQWSFAADVYRNNLDFADLEEVSVGSIEGRNRSVTLFNAWQNPGDITTIPRVNSALSSVNYINQTDRYLEDASFLRLRNITLGYSLPKSVLEKTLFTKLRFYVQGENLFTFTKFRGWDPEANLRTTNRGQFPTPKIFTFGTTIDF